MIESYSGQIWLRCLLLTCSYKIKMKSTCNYQIFMLFISECAFFHSIPGETFLSYTKKFMQKKNIYRV